MHDDQTRATARSLAVLIASCALAASCVPGRVGTVAVFVTLRTDLTPGEEFTAVRVQLTAADGRRVARSETQVVGDNDTSYLEGARVLEATVPQGPHLVEVVLVGRAGGATATRRVAFEATGPDAQSVTVLVSRASLACDAAACGEGETCGPSGACIDAYCTPESRESCPPPACEAASDCPPPAACASAICDASGACFYGSGGGTPCPGGEFCEPTVGCIPRTTPIGDTGTRCESDADCDDGPCLDVGEGLRACTRGCAVDGDCMRGWTCGAAPDGSGNVCLCTFASGETCNGSDDDCDGSVDENGVCWADVGMPCSDREACASELCLPVDGDASVCSNTCRNDGDCVAGWSCEGVDGVSGGICLCTATPETCNERDDDCNGRVDDGIPCYPPSAGCTSPELCNRTDDDCDGTIDESCTIDVPGAPTETCNARDDDWDGYCDDGAACTRGIHRAYHPGRRQHLYSISTIEIASASELVMQAEDYFRAYVAPAPGLVPLYRCYWADTGAHLLTQRPDCEGARNENPIGFVAPGPTCGALPLYELRTPDRQNYFYTLSAAERRDLLKHTNMRDWGIAAWVWPSESTCTTPRPEICGNGRDDDCDGLVDCYDVFDCCASGECMGYGMPGAYRIRCCNRGWVNIARSENHCGGCFTQCRNGFMCVTTEEGSGHCNCLPSMPACPRGQECVERIAPNDGRLHYRCSCTTRDHCTDGFECRSIGGPLDGMHNICHPTL